MCVARGSETVFLKGKFIHRKEEGARKTLKQHKS